MLLKHNPTMSPRMKNNEGVVLILALLGLVIPFIMTAGLAYISTNHQRQANNYKYNLQAYWMAELGINRFLQNPIMLDGADPNYLINQGSYYVILNKDDSDPAQRIVIATGYAGGISRTLKVVFPANPPDVFDNTVSSGSNLNLLGLIAKLEVFGPTRLTGTFTKSGLGASGWFQDKQEGVASNRTTLKYPDAGGNSTPDEFNDFVTFNQELLSTYSPDEVVYIQSNDTMMIYPSSALVGKKIIYVEGTTAGAGDVEIVFDATWQNGQNLTVISTGSVEYSQPLQTSSDSQLNIIAWDDYTEASILYASHNGVTYAHDTANYYSILEYSETKGNLIANNQINANEALSWKKFQYSNPVLNGLLPPGFEGLVAYAPPGYSSTPGSWGEI